MIDPLLPHLMPPFCVQIRLRREGILARAVAMAKRDLGDAHQAMLSVAAAFDTSIMEVEDACTEEGASRERLAGSPEA